MNRFHLLVATLLLGCGCSDFDTPAQLSRPQIVGLRAEPPVLSQGAAVRVSGLVAGPVGPMSVDFEWSIEAHPGITMTTDDNGTWLRAAPQVAATSLELTARAVANGAELFGVRTIEVASDPKENPSIEEIWVDGVAIPEGAVASLSPGVAADLDISATSQNLVDSSVSWYATTGEFERYRVAPTRFDPPTHADTGWLVVVVRDGLGGINWQTRELVVR